MSVFNYYDRTSVNDGTSAQSTLNLSYISSTIQLLYPGDTYFDSTNKIGPVYVYYMHQDGRQVKRIVHPAATHQSLASWSSNARDGTWQKMKLKIFDNDGASVLIDRSSIGVSEDLTHSLGSMTLNINAVAPIADFHADNLNPGIGQSINFFNDSTGTVTGRDWTFGDGQYSTLQNPSHSYGSPAPYTVSLRVTGPGGSDLKTRTNYINVGVE